MSAPPADPDAGKQKVMYAAQHIVKSLATSKNAADDMMRILSGFDNRLYDLKPPTSSSPPATPPVVKLDVVSEVHGEAHVEAVAAHKGKNLSDVTDKFAGLDVRDERQGGKSVVGNQGLRNVAKVVDQDDQLGKEVLSEEAPGHLEALVANAESVIDAFLSADMFAHGMIFDVGNQDGRSAEFTAAVKDLLTASEDECLLMDLRERVETYIQLAMARLEEEFRKVLERDSAVVAPSEDLHYSFLRRFSVSAPSFHASVSDLDNPALAAAAAAAVENEAGNRLSISDDQITPFVISPGAVSVLHEIAELMLRAGYEDELCQVYGDVRREALVDCLAALGVEKMSIEEVQRVGWEILDSKMKKWIQILRAVVKGLLAEEHRACDQIFAASESIKNECFAEAAKACLLQLLNFGDAIAIGKRSTEKLFRILGMYEALADVLPDIDTLFSDSARELIKEEAEGILARLGEAVRGTVAEFSHAIQGETSRRPLLGGEIHPLTRYVMNYVRLLSDYSGSLNSLLDFDVNDRDLSGDNPNITPLGHCVYMLIAHLQTKIDEKAKLYEDESLQNIFKMNNLLYIVQKVRDSELKTLLGDNWIRKRRGLIRQYSTSYLRASWNKVLACLRDDGMSTSGMSPAALKAALKEKFRNFNLTFEEIYRVQTTWKVPDPQLREELKISVSEMVLPAYRSFVGRYRSQLESGRNPTKYIKYSPEELENQVAELFEGKRNA